MRPVVLAARLSWLVALAFTAACTASGEEAAHRSNTIIQGAVESGEPAVVKILLDASNGTANFYCSGTVVGTRTVLTAAHCIDLTTQPKTLVEINNKIFNAARIVRHPGWNKSTSAYLNDLGLVTLDQVAPVTPQVVASSAPTTGETIKLVGFGRTDPNDSSTGRNKHTSNMSVGAVSSTYFEIDGYDGNAAPGDSGGAALATVGGSKQLIAVVSTSAPDWKTSYHIRVDAFRTWLASESSGNIQFAGGPPPADIGVPQRDTGPPGDGTAPAAKPKVTITTPTEGATTPEAIYIEATVAHDKPIKQVQAYVDTTPIGSQPAPPYRFFAQVGPGQHVIRVTARDESDVIGEDTVNVTASQTAADFGVPPDLGMQPPVLDATGGAGDGSTGGTGGTASGGCAAAPRRPSGVALGLVLLAALCLVRRRRRRRRRRRG